MIARKWKRKHDDKKKVLSNNESDKKVQSKKYKNVWRKINIELKKEILEHHEHDICVTDLALENKMVK